MMTIFRSTPLLGFVPALLAGALLMSNAQAAAPASAAAASAAPAVHAASLHARATSTTALTVASAAGANGSGVLLLATVGGESRTVSGGSVVFTAQGKRIGEATVTNGSASLTVPALPAGLSTLSASYKGDDDFLPSKSATVRFYQDDQD